MKEQTSAIIVEIRGSYAAALREDGVFVRVRNEKYEIGQSISLNWDETPVRQAQTKRRRARFTAYASMAAGFLLLLLGGFKGYTTPIGVVSLDVNPSIEYSINCFDRVLDISAVNEDGSTILAQMDENALRFRPVDEAVEATIGVLRENGYFAEVTENDVVISASSYNAQHTEQIAERLGTLVGKQDDLTVYSVPVSRGEVQSAHDLGTSAGKLQIIERLGESLSSSEAFDPEDWVEKPVREIIAETKANADQQKTDEEDKHGRLKPNVTDDLDQAKGNTPAQSNNSSGNSQPEPGESPTAPAAPGGGPVPGSGNP